MGISGSMLGGLGSTISQFGGAVGGQGSFASNVAPISANVAQSQAQAEYEKQRQREEEKAKKGGIFKKILGGAGSVGGAILGTTLFPGLGTIAGSALGSAAGGTVGDVAGQLAAGEKLNLANALMQGATSGVGTAMTGGALKLAGAGTGSGLLGSMSSAQQKVIPGMAGTAMNALEEARYKKPKRDAATAAMYGSGMIPGIYPGPTGW